MSDLTEGKLPPRMLYWKSIQARFQELENVVFAKENGYVTKIELDGSRGSDLPRFDWSCVIQTESSSFTLELDWVDTRSAAFTCLAQGSYEPEIERILCGALKEASNPTFVDIGANEGFHSINCLSSVPGATVIAFEPNPFVRARLISNLKTNGHEHRSTVESFGLSHKKGAEIFYVPRLTGSGGGSLRNLHAEEGDPLELSVQLETLDSFHCNPSVMKIDVEGNEMNVLLGAQETIARSRPLIVAELLRKWMEPFGSTPQHAANLIIKHGYEMYAIGNDYTRRIDLIDEQTPETNFLFIPLPEHSAEI